MNQYLNDQISNLIGRIEVNDNICTAWKASPDGHIITVGHIFKDNKSKIGSSFLVDFFDDSKIEAKLLEYDSNEDSGIDYALLKSSESFGNNFIRVQKQSKFDAVKFLSKGFRVENGDKRIPFNGEIVGSVDLKSTKRKYYRLKISEQRTVGFSGAPILVYNNGWKCIGIQSCREIKYLDFELSNHVWGIRFGAEINSVLEEQKASVDFERHILDLLLDKNYPRRAQTGINRRFTKILYHYQKDNERSSSINEMIQERWREKKKELTNPDRKVFKSLKNQNFF